MEGRQRDLRAVLVVGVPAGETDTVEKLLCFCMIALMAISCTMLLQGWEGGPDVGWAVSAAVSAISQTMVCAVAGRLEGGRGGAV